MSLSSFLSCCIEFLQYRPAKLEQLRNELKKLFSVPPKSLLGASEWLGADDRCLLPAGVSMCSYRLDLPPPTVQLLDNAGLRAFHLRDCPKHRGLLEGTHAI